MPIPTMIQLKRDRVIHELAGSTGPGRIVSPQHFRECLHKALDVWPGRPDEFKIHCADEFAVSSATLDRWMQGKSAPTMSVRIYVLDRLRRFLTDANHGRT